MQLTVSTADAASLPLLTIPGTRAAATSASASLSGEAVTTVAARLGHPDTSTMLKVYGHLMPGADSRAAGIVGSAFKEKDKAT